MTDLRSLYGSGGGKEGSAEAPTEDKDTLFNNTIAEIVENIGEGRIGGLINGAKSIFLDGVPLENAAGKKNFKGVRWEERKGTPDPAPFKGFSDIEATVQVALEVTKDIAIIQTIEDNDLDDLRITVMLPALVFVNEGGDIKGSSVEMRADIRPVGGTEWTEMVTMIIKGKTTSNYYKSYRIEDVPTEYGPGPWEVRVRRITDDSDSSKLQNRTYWSSYTSIINERLSMPDIARIALRVNAKQFGQHIPNRSYEVAGFDQLQVPSNYNVSTREYSGVWDGTLVPADGPIDNPAWCLYDILTNTRYGLGVDPAYIDIFGLYEIGKYCDELVPDGTAHAYSATRTYAVGDCVLYKEQVYECILATTGHIPTNTTYWQTTAKSMEPRFTFNYVIQSREEAYNVLNSMASSFRSMLYWGASYVTVAQDSPQDATHIANQTTVEGGLFHYSSFGLPSRHSVALVSWNDMDDEGRASVEVYEDPDLVNEIGWVTTDVLATGCSSRGQARRQARWTIYTEKTQQDSVSFIGGWYYANCMPGCLVLLHDPATAGFRGGGRISSGSTAASIKLDSPLNDSIVLDDSSDLIVTLPSGAIERKPITDISEDRTIIYTDEFSEAPAANAIWIMADSQAEPRLFRVLANNEISPHKYELFAVEHDPGKFKFIEQDLVIDPKPFSRLPTGELQAPRNVHVRKYTYTDGKNSKVGVHVSWKAVEDPRVHYYEVQWRPDDENWTKFGTSSDVSADRKNVKLGIYDFRIRSVGVGRSVWHNINNVDISKAPRFVPPRVTGFTLVNGTADGDEWVFPGLNAHFKWDDIRTKPYFSDSQFRHYRIWVEHPETNAIVHSEEITDQKWQFDYERNKEHFGGNGRSRYTVKIVAVDIEGRDSGVIATLTVNSSAPPNVSDIYVKGGGTTFRGKDCILEWPAIDYPDKKLWRYKIHIHDPDNPGGNPVRIVKRYDDERWKYTQEDMEHDFGGTTPLSFTVEIVAQSVYGDESPVAKVVTFSHGAIPSVQNLRVRGKSVGDSYFVGEDCEIDWDNVVNADTFPESRFSKYRVRVFDYDTTTYTDGNVLRESFTVRSRYNYTFKKNQDDTNNDPQYRFKIRVAVVTTAGHVGPEVMISPRNARPDMSSFTPAVMVMYDGLLIDWSGWIAPRDITKYAIYCGTSNPPNALRAKISAKNDRWFFKQDLSSRSATWHVQVFPEDCFGPDDPQTGGSQVKSVTTDPDNILPYFRGKGVNVVHPRYSIFEDSKLPALSFDPAHYGIYHDKTAGYFGNRCLRTNALQPHLSGVYLGKTDTNYNIRLSPGKKWLVACMLKCSSAAIGQKVRIHLKTNDVDTEGEPASETRQVFEHILTSSDFDGWQLHYGTLDLTAVAAKRAVMRIDYLGTSGYVYWDAFFVEERVGGQEVPSAFSLPSAWDGMRTAEPPDPRVEFTPDSLSVYSDEDTREVIIDEDGIRVKASDALYDVNSIRWVNATNNTVSFISGYESSTSARLELSSDGNVVSKDAYGRLYAKSGVDKRSNVMMLATQVSSGGGELGAYIEVNISAAHATSINLSASTITLGGAATTANQITSTLATGTAPLAVTSTTKCVNLNADLLDGLTSAELFQLAQDNIVAGNIIFGNAAERSLTAERRASNDAGPGKYVYITGGACSVADTNRDGGTVVITGGISRGDGEGGVTIRGIVKGTTGSATDNTTVYNCIRIMGDRMAFFTNAPITKPTTVNAATSTSDIVDRFNELLTRVKNLGLIASS